MNASYYITLLLISANIVFSLIGFNNRRFTNETIMWPYRVKREQQYYRFFSSGFLHADMMHLFFNMFTLFFFGRNLEILFDVYRLGGPTSYLLLYFSALVISDLPGYMKNADNPGYRSLGASGAVSAVVFASIIFSPWSSVYLYGAIRISFLIYAILYLYYCIYMSKISRDNINHEAHLWGAVYGFVYALGLVLLMNRSLLTPILNEFSHPSFLGH
jgi:membrane associated rhomboid family serine protease